MTLELLTSDLSAATRPTPLLLVHGAWHGAWCWQEHFIPYLARAGYAVYAPSLRGHGDSPGRDRLRRTGIGHYVQDVAAVAAALPAAPVLIGHSMGGLVVQKYLERYPAAAGGDTGDDAAHCPASPPGVSQGQRDPQPLSAGGDARTGRGALFLPRRVR